MKSSYIVIFSAALMILLSSCGPSVYSFSMLKANDSPTGVNFVSEAWWHEAYGDICIKVGSKTYRRVNFCIVHNHMAYAFTGKAKGRVYVLKPAGLDGWGIVSEADWIDSPQDYFLKTTKSKLSD
ncbi:hypothetical protein BH11VER1_BH11VER1_21370 [soil metagenome]